GANLGFKKEAFKKVGGYSNNLFTPSGDDEFLLFNIMTQFPYTTRFLKSKEAIVTTAPHDNMLAFLNQRKRWTSKWKYNKNWKAKLLYIFFFIDYSSFYLALALVLAQKLSIVFFLVVLLVRFASEFMYVYPIDRFTGGRSTFSSLLVIQIIYPLQFLLMGINSIFGSYTWKGRKY
ncbi:MAG: hypothetical protein HRT61_08840, partial [Ekhidna sp.]|nr:hypothetical protein [Ekhidna sp.]